MTHPFEKITLNKCINKGHARIWIEGSILEVNKFSNNETFYKNINFAPIVKWHNTSMVRMRFKFNS